MRRLRATQNQVALSLFPFLAVLICTMGALIVLLVVVVRNAKVQAEEIATVVDTQQLEEQQLRQEQLAEELAEQQRQREDNLWRLELLATQRQDMTQQLENKRLELSHLEEHHRRLAEQLEQKLREAASFDQLEETTQQDQQQLAADLASLESAIARAEQELTEARQQIEATQRSFALLPYDGPQGTRRRPIYIECTEQAVVIQPEGIVLAPSDFSGPLGPGNPLDAALRAVREYMSTTGLLAAGEEPYPLLVVRPGGTVSYNYVRAAMTSWDDEFGYELIDGEMKLAYGEPDPERARAMARAIDEARQRTKILRAAAPTRFDGTEVLSFTEQSGGGNDLLGKGGSNDPLATGRGGGSSGGSYGRSRGSLSGGFSGERGYPGGDDNQLAGGQYGSGQYGSGQYGSDQNGSGQYSGSAAGKSAEGNRSGAESSNQASAGNASGEGGKASKPGRQSMAGGRQASGGGSATGGSPGQQGQPGQRQFPQQRIANTHGANWANPGASREGTGYNRPISMICYADRIEIPASGEQPMQTIAFLGSTGNGVGALVQGVTRRVNAWGLAGQGAYWKPILRIDVQPGAEQRYADLQVLLDKSGLELERK